MMKPALISAFLQLITTLQLAISLASCGANSAKPKHLQIQVELAASGTHVPVNKLLFSQTGGQSLGYRLSSKTIWAEQEFDRVVDVLPELDLHVATPGQHELEVEVFGSDGALMMQQTLTWDFGTELPPTPLVGFEYEGVNSTAAFLLVSGNRGESVKEIWVSGDLDASDKPEGSWRDIPDSAKVPVMLSSGDGIKHLSVKYRNIYGIESDEVGVNVLLKTTPPAICKVELKSTVVRAAVAEVAISGSVADDVYVAFFGDSIGGTSFRKVSGRQIFPIELRNLEGKNRITVMVRDKAQNFCPRTEYEITVDPNHLPGEVTIGGGELWTDAEEVSVHVSFDHFASDQTEMKIIGQVEPGPNTFQWIPYQRAFPVRLSPSAGQRTVLVQFRDKKGLHPYSYYNSVHLKPRLLAFLQGGQYRLSLSNIVGMTSFDVNGCAQTYVDSAYVQSVPCTPVASRIDVTYKLKDGTTVARYVDL